MSERLRWSKLLSEKRLGESLRPPAAPSVEKPEWMLSTRLEAERDYDRILFCTPTRRLGDKTQVFPLEKNESVRTRLTHSHEVSNLARSIGIHIVNSDLGDRIEQEIKDEGNGFDSRIVRRSIPAMMAAIGLAHDLGNPPFGHQGEQAIRTWITSNEITLFKGLSGPNVSNPLTDQHKEDLRQFEGNAHTLRTVTRLQIVRDDKGLNLTAGTLAALMKYTVDSTSIDPSKASTKKVGFFQSEKEIVREIHKLTGLSHGLRHPLTYLMEACDDIAYSIIDAEDAVKKQIVSFSDLAAWLRSETADDGAVSWILSRTEAAANECRIARLSPAESNDVSMQVFRTCAIGAMISAVINSFTSSYNDIMEGTFTKDLIGISKVGPFCRAMKKFDRIHAYQHRKVLEVELAGYNTIHELMNLLWRGIVERSANDNLASTRTSPFARYAYGRISENYRRVFEGGGQGGAPIRYRELQLLTDMIAGMTDSFALEFCHELRAFAVGASAS